MVHAQLLSLDKLAQEAISVTSNQEIRKLTPERIQSVNDTLNAATALFVRDLSDGAIDRVAAYKPYHCLQKAEHIYATYRKAAAKNIGPGEEYDLVDEFATQLGVRGWYVWRPDTGAGQDATPQATTDPAPARRIDSPAALIFLVSALDRLKNLSDAEIKSIATETALKGTTGIDLDSPEKIHSISAFGNERMSGLEFICLMHVAFQRIHAGTDVGVDFSHIWPTAQMMHAARNP